MNDESAIVSHVANQAYREHVDEMTCEYPGCRRWKVGDGSEYCKEHDWDERTRDANRIHNHASMSRGIGMAPSYFDVMRIRDINLRGHG